MGIGTNNFGLAGQQGPKVSAVEIDQSRATSIIRAALDAGVTFIDTAEEYGCMASRRNSSSASPWAPGGTRP